MLLQAIEAVAPQRPVGSEPVVDLAQGLWAETVHAALGVDARLNEACVAQDAEVFGNRGLTEFQVIDEVGNGLLALPQGVEDLAAVRLGEDLEGRQHTF
jgi:hypothetical protein